MAATKGQRRSGSPSRATQQRQMAKVKAATVRTPPASDTAAPSRRSFFTQRAVIFILVISLLALSYLSTLSVYFTQQRQLAATREAIAEHERNIERLDEEVKQWQDDEFVKTQARERLGWVIPGETGFRVVGPDGQPYAGGQEIGEATLPSGEHAATWWDRMWLSVQTADDPTATENREAAPPDEPVEDSDGG